jgi:hypothetical protein
MAIREKLAKFQVGRCAALALEGFAGLRSAPRADKGLVLLDETETSIRDRPAHGIT